MSVKQWYFNRCSSSIERQGGHLILHRYAICDVASSAKILLSADLSLGYGARKGSKVETQLKMGANARIETEGNFRVFFGASVEVFDNGILKLGRGYINTGSTLACAHQITIGDGAAIARGVYIYDSDHHSILGVDGHQTNVPAPIVIGKQVWIGAGAIILKGVTIGDGTVVAAGAVVTRDLPPNCVAAGNPARPIKTISGWR